MHQLPLDVQPQEQSSKSISSLKYKTATCQQCGGPRSRNCKRCRNCAFPRPDIVQPLGTNIRLIALTRGKITTVDANRYADLLQWKWHARLDRTTGNYYACRTEQRNNVQVAIPMHRYLLGLSEGEIGDHINGDTLDNRLENLRKATVEQSAQNKRIRKSNTSGFIGVVFCKRTNKWRGQVEHNGRNNSAGFFDRREDAARARDRKAIELFGDFAVLNFPREDYL